MGRDRAVIGIVSQRVAETDEPRFDELYEVGTIARVVKIIRLGPSNYSVVLHGLSRIRLLAPVSIEPYMRARVQRVFEDLERDAELDALGASLREGMRQVITHLPNLPRETSGILDNVRESGALADLIASNLAQEQATVADKQRVLETFNAKERVRFVLSIVNRQLELLRVKHEISTMVADEGKSQREAILRQQMKAIKEELGETSDEDDLDELRDRLRLATPPEEVLKATRKQLSRLSVMQPQSAEYNVTRSYIEWIVDMPWSKTTPDTLEVEQTRRCLDEDHYGLEKVKKRIVEYVAVRGLRADKKGPILCFIGPPGVGKTSLGRSIARSMGRRYHRVALGGVRDEAEVRGHRRTYVGALPGRIIQGLKKVGVRNPVVVFDEVDKLGADVMGDPSSALLEVLDPEQNSAFADHYLELPFDLSQVTFLATANNLETIPGPLADRMEIIEVSGYTQTEKLSIAREFLCPKQLSSHGITDERLEFRDDGVGCIIDFYTREAGVRGLEREIGAICRHVAMQLAEGNDVHLVADASTVQTILGPRKYTPELAERLSLPGVATGLAWTPAGGHIVFIEATKMPGKGEVTITGNLKAVMSESANTAVSLVRSRAARLGLDPEFLKTIDLHLHVPKGGTPKDGASAGVTMYSAVASLLLKRAVRKDIAMTGEITLRGNVLAVGGIKEKLLAAHRAGIREVLLPARNEADLEDVPSDVRAELKVHLVKRMDEVLPLVLEPAPAPAPAPGDDKVV
jgi:ATP-dependent Lon protease